MSKLRDDLTDEQKELARLLDLEIQAKEKEVIGLSSEYQKLRQELQPSVEILKRLLELKKLLLAEEAKANANS